MLLAIDSVTLTLDAAPVVTDDAPMERLADLTKNQLTHARSLDYARWISAQAFTGAAGPQAAAQHFLERWPQSFSVDLVRKALTLDTQAIELDRKAAIAAGTTTGADWAAPLIGPQPLAEAFLTIVRPLEIVDQLPGVRKVPLNTPIPIWNPTAPSSASWVGEGLLKPIVSFSFGKATLTTAKIQVMCSVTRELLELAMPGSETSLRDVLAFQLSTGVNEEFILPARAAVANGRPGSVTNVGTLVTTANDPVVDTKAVLAALQAARPTATPVLVMDATAAAAVIATNLHPNLTLAGGIAYGAQVIVAAAAGKTIAAIDPSAVLLSDLGVEFTASSRADIVMDNAPVGGAGAVVQSMFQLNMTALRAERFISWKLTAATAVQYTTRA